MLSMLTSLFKHMCFLVFVLGATPNHIPLKYRCLKNISKLKRVVYHTPLQGFGVMTCLQLDPWLRHIYMSYIDPPRPPKILFM